MELLTEACKWIIQGIGVIPIWPKQKTPALRSWLEFQTRLPTLEELDRWFRLPRNLGIVCGWKGLVVLDFDQFDRFVEWWALFPLETYMVSTSRGVHVYLFCDQVPGVHKLAGIDIQGPGRYVLAPPSVHPSGIAYQVLGDWPIMRIRKIEDVLPAEWMQTVSLGANVHKPALEPKELTPQVRKENPWVTAVSVSSKSLVERVREAYRIEGLFPHPLIPSDPSGRWFMTLCPLHEDHNPSMWVDLERQICGCRAGCNNGKTMDVASLYARLKGLTNGEAIRELGEKL